MNLTLIEQQGFDLVEMVDETSQTVAWKAVQRTLGRTVVLRILKPAAAASPISLDHFLSIARIVSRVKSESIASIFDIVSADGLHYVVMEHVDGPLLGELVEQEGPLSADRALRIAASLIAGLSQLWETAHVVHRNLKSNSVRLAAHGVAKLVDFSLAIQAGPGINATALDDGHIVGTPCFLSPEQAQGTHTLNPQSDMYALGIVLYHLATGNVPFEGLDAISILSAQVKQHIPPPHRLESSVPTAFSLFLRRLLMKDPDDRYPDWQAVLHDIRLLIGGHAPADLFDGDDFPSTIEPFDADEAVGPAGPKFRLRRPKKEGGASTYTAASLLAEHTRDIRRATRFKELCCWISLSIWLATLLWFRAVYQTDAGSGPQQQPETTGQESDSLPPAFPTDEEAAMLLPPDSEPPAPVLATPAPAATPPEAPAASGDPRPPPAPEDEPAAPLPSGIPPGLAAQLAKAFADGSLQTARNLLQADPSPFQEKNQLAELLDRIPDPGVLIARYMGTRIGKPLVFEHNGKQRTVIPREITDGILRVEANGRGIDISITSLSADEKLRWMDIPKDDAHSVAYCLTLLNSSRRDEVRFRAASCPLLAPILIEAASLK